MFMRCYWEARTQGCQRLIARDAGGGRRQLISRDAGRSKRQPGGLCVLYCLLQLLELRLAWVVQLVPWVGGLARCRQCTWQDRPADWSLPVVLARPALDWRVTVGGMPEEAVAVGELRWRPQGGLRGAVRELRQRPQGGSRWRHSVRETCNWRDSFNMDMVSCVPLSAWTASVNLLSLWTDYLEYSCMAEAQSG